MPFTFTHPALILPLTFLPRSWFSLTGLIIGSIIPDFEYFIRMRIESNYSHTLTGIWWFDLPLGLMIAFVFHKIVRNKLFDNLPLFIKSRLIKFRTFNWTSYARSNWIILILSLLIGTASHILWDNFTHHDGFFVTLFPVLSTQLVIGDIIFPIYKFLQHLSTMVGGFIIVIAFYNLPVQEHIESQINWNYWSVLVALSFTIMMIRILMNAETWQVGNLIVTWISAILISLVLTPFILKVVNTHYIKNKSN